MKFLRSSLASAQLILHGAVVASIVMVTSFASAFTPVWVPPSERSSFSPTASFQSSSYSVERQRQRRTSLASNKREDLEDQLLSIQNSWKTKTDTEGTLYRSDVPSDDSNNNAFDIAKEFRDRSFLKKFKLPPPPEDQFVMTGDIAFLFFYAYTSHSINDSMVRDLLDDPRMTIPEVVKVLDPSHEILNLQLPVWVDLTSNPNIPFGNPAVNKAFEVSARETLMSHWGPLLSTEGSTCVALCTCWLIAGWLHRSFLFDYSTYCGPERVLTKTVETWLTMALLLAIFATGTDWLVGHFPALQSLLCVTCNSAENASSSAMGEFHAAMATTDPLLPVKLPMMSVFSLTQSDVIFVVDSLMILIAWRWSAHRLVNIFR